MRKKRIRILAYVVLFYAAVMACIWTLNQSWFRIDHLEIEGNNLLTYNDLQSQIDEYLDGQYFFFFPKDSIFWYSGNQLSKQLRTHFSEISSMEVKLARFDTLQVVIKERVQAYYAHVNDQLYDLDATGVLFRISEVSVPEEVVFSVSSEEEREVKLGERLIDQNMFLAANELLNNLRAEGVTVSRVEFKNPIESLIQLNTGEIIIVDPSTNQESIEATLQEVLTYKEFQYDRSKGIFNQPIDYINLRYGDKIFYCYQGDQCEGNYTID